jgi:hypothetical protein
VSHDSGCRKCYCMSFICCICVKVFINTLERSAQNVVCIAAVVNVRSSSGFRLCKEVRAASVCVCDMEHGSGDSSTLKADSHITCRVHAVPLPLRV